MALERIGIIGAGQMGTGIAHVLALAGYDVVLDDVNKEALGKALDRIEKNMQRQAAKGSIEESAIQPALARIKTTQTMDDLRDRDLWIEAATEDESVKKAIFKDLCTRISDKTIIATNTSTDRDLLGSLRAAPAAAQAGGLSGAPLHPLSVMVIAQLRAELGAIFPIIGVGGIVSADQALATLRAGANLIQVYTGFAYRGPELLDEIIHALSR